MKNIEIHYNPYKMITTMHIEGIDVCQSRDYSNIRRFIEQGTPLQTWIEPIPYLGWNGFVDEISDPENNDEVRIIFSGRKIDFQDLQHAIEEQNASRSEGTRVKYHYEHKKVLDDKKLSQNIDEVVRELKSDRFRKLVEQRTAVDLNERYRDLDKNYKTAKENEFFIVFAGVYSSGKSTLLNVLMRHDILPTSDQTCTSKNCRIKHNSSLGNRIALTCYDKDKNIIVKRQVFTSDEECAEAFFRISPTERTDIQEQYADVNTMEVEVDLSHLYPENVSEDKFRIVLIDTPGMDSAESSKNGSNEHEDTALEAISMNSKPMILLCVDAKTYENKNIGEFMREIIEQSKEESGFNDRFLFLMNKSDALVYKTQNGESAEKAKKRFAEYLTDPSKWGIKTEEEELQQIAEAASHFVPRIFMTTARVAYAIQKKAFEYNEDEDDDVVVEALYNAYKNFRNNVCKERKDYWLLQYCDIPNYRKSEIEAEFKTALEEKKKVKATELQCGLISVECAIRDYIGRYAYPIKVRGLLETFEAILDDVNGFTNGILADLRQAKIELGERNGEREEVGKRKKSTEEKIAALEDARIKIDMKILELNRIQFDSMTLDKTIKGVLREINANSDIQFLRDHIYGGVNTGQKSRWEVESEITSRIYRIKNFFDTRISETNKVLEFMKKTYDAQISKIFEVVRDTVAELEKAGVLSQGEYKFTDGVWWKMNLGNISSEQLISDAKVSIVDRTTKTEKVRNAKKDEWSSSWNPFKKLGSLFMDEYKTVERKVDGSYKTAQIMNRITNYTKDIDAKSKEMEKGFKDNLEVQKKQVNDLINRIFQEVSSFLADIRRQEMQMENLGDSIVKLDDAIQKNSATYAWLNSLKRKIEEE
ncbi:MAG: dynamin family protein [Lachnospiraceae bacterium]|nr:dynamin family protein [Lachnospiraceae bacterium]